MTLGQADEILGRGMICLRPLPSRAVVDQKNSGQIGLNIIIAEIKLFQLQRLKRK